MVHTVSCRAGAIVLCLLDDTVSPHCRRIVCVCVQEGVSQVIHIKVTVV